MLLRSVTQHVKNQNWFAVCIDFLIVVVGVFIGIQVANWNESRSNHEESIAYIQRLQADVESDIKNYGLRLEFWMQVYEDGNVGLDYVKSNSNQFAEPNTSNQSFVTEPIDHWTVLLALFNASQIWEFYTTSATYEEMTNAGDLRLIKDVSLRSNITSYYLDSVNEIMTERPQYRERVRRLIPIKIQDYMWENCHKMDKPGEQSLVACASPMSEAQAQQVVKMIITDKELMSDLRYWMSTLKVTSKIGQERVLIAKQLLKKLQSYNNHPNN